jgi:hypothetical protein
MRLLASSAFRASAALTAAATIASAQGAPAPSAAATAPARIPPASEQIAAAVLPAPNDMRASATVLGYAPDGRFVTLRKGSGALVCLASDPKRDQFHVACYHRSLEPFMARGRSLRAHGITGDQVDTVRFREIRAGKLAMPRHPAMLYTLTGPAGSFDPATRTAPGAHPLFVVYIPYATAESLGLSPQPVEGTPWVMYPGTPKAHIMFIPKM